MTTENDMIKLITSHNWTLNNPADPEDIRKLEKAAGPLPEDYKVFLAHTDGGSITNDFTVLIIYSIQEVLEIHKDKSMYKQISPSLNFGGDGGGLIYCFDLRPGKEQHVFLIGEFEADVDPDVYNKLIYEGTTLTDSIQRFINNEITY